MDLTLTPGCWIQFGVQLITVILAVITIMCLTTLLQNRNSDCLPFYLCHSKKSVHVQGCMLHLVTCYVFMLSSFSALPNLQLEDHPLSAVCNYLHNIFTASRTSAGQILHWQTENVPCHGDRAPLITAMKR